jgi:hypothetical protein
MMLMREVRTEDRRRFDSMFMKQQQAFRTKNNAPNGYAVVVVTGKLAHSVVLRIRDVCSMRRSRRKANNLDAAGRA